ncbi:MAG: chemotaxis protein CheA [Prolixibacteraceae bacterium]|jgi:two-component system, chemotaxis family, sensor kinase CheA|nr:chemotaxis protein CheA [Prolixibacteraceae bacterium]MBT6766177.1 chemotaxis protein CheA [Prolixibacteraceae bacterium]MBT6997576.1 chemotaxis protein CheA [Prolixibacteraceae bacterium]MBT7397179.1 chemotaxis protein CheA [Prolixibacteraceae bacterium]
MAADEMLNEFLIECNESLNQLDNDLVIFEEDPSSQEILASIFRTFHTIKGSSGFLALNKLETISHKGENLLSLIRENKIAVDRDIINVLFLLVDAIREIILNLSNKGTEGENNYEVLLQKLEQLQASEKDVPAKIMAPKNDEGAILEKVDALKENVENLSGITDTKIRVDVSTLDSLMNLVGELVLARNRIMQFKVSEDTAYLSSTHKLNLVTSELQTVIMKTRLQEINNIWSKFHRMVRDLAVAKKKSVNLVLEGKETELDRTIIEAINDPLVHLVRNSIDHGIETPAQRRKNGKPPMGTLRLSAFHEGGQVNIEIFDDGAGIDPEKIKEKAISKGIISIEKAAQLSPQESINLIFKSGFSTAKTVTNISGRGVGMDIVKTNIEKIGGSIEIHSKPGENSFVRIKIPLTLAIVPALIVSSGIQKYAIPQLNLLELVRLELDDNKTQIEMVHNAPVFRLRGKLLQIIYLDRIFREGSGKNGTHQLNGNKKTLNIVVLKSGNHEFGLVVDEVHNTQDIVVKSLGKKLKNINYFSGATILGDGAIALILDILGIGHNNNIISDVLHKDDSGAKTKSNIQKLNVEKQTLLLISDLMDNQMAIPLNTVARLEEFLCSKIEISGNKAFIQYRNKILPLIVLSNVFIEDELKKEPPEKFLENKETLKVVVVKLKSGKSFGIIVDKIIDILETEIIDKGPAPRKGVLYTFVMKKHITEMIDFDNIVNKVESQLIAIGTN